MEGYTIINLLKDKLLNIKRNKAKNANAEIVVDLNTTFYGTREFAMKDCDGYLLIFAEE